MFKSSEKLRQEAAARQLDRVASSWRQARTTWFDGTPEAIEARLAETNRILTVARSGYSPAHIGLTVEAENARKELLAAKHRLLTDFLDDGARAFQGSQRVALDYHDHPGVPLNQLPLPGMSPYGEDPVAVAFDAHGEPADQSSNWESAQSLAQNGYNVQAVGDDIGTRGDGSQWTRMKQDKIQDLADYEKRLREDIGFPPVSLRDYHEGSRRVAGKHDPDPERPWKNQATGEDTPTDHWENLHLSPFDDVDDYEGKHRESSRRVGYGEHSMRDRIDEAYENGGRLDRSLVGVNPGDGIYRNHPGMLDGYDEGPYMGSEYGYDAGSDPDFVPADYLGPAPYQGGEPGLHRRDF